MPAEGLGKRRGYLHEAVGRLGVVRRAIEALLGPQDELRCGPADEAPGDAIRQFGVAVWIIEVAREVEADIALEPARVEREAAPVRLPGRADLFLRQRRTFVADECGGIRPIAGTDVALDDVPASI